MTCCADAGVVDFMNTERAALPDDISSEIDFVVRRANARTELHNQVRGIGPEAINHLSDRVRDDPELGTFASGMHKADSSGFRIYDVNRATIGDVNAECDTYLVGDDTVARSEFAAHSGSVTAIDHGNVVPVDLLSGEQRPIADTDRLANLSMGAVESL